MNLDRLGIRILLVHMEIMIDIAYYIKSPFYSDTHQQSISKTLFNGTQHVTIVQYVGYKVNCLSQQQCRVAEDDGGHSVLPC